MKNEKNENFCFKLSLSMKYEGKKELISEFSPFLTNKIYLQCIQSLSKNGI